MSVVAVSEPTAGALPLSSPQSRWSSTQRAALERLLEHVEPRFKKKCRRMLYGEPVSFAQGWQDWYIFHNLFRDRLSWGNGTYVDIGSNNPTISSNTLFFDKCLGWRGVCFEPQARYHAATRTQRSCTLVPNCVLGVAANATLVGAGQLGRMVIDGEAPAGPGGRAAAGAAPKHPPPGGGNASSEPQRQECVVAGDVLPPLGIKSIDLLSLDVEGHEPNVLRCWPFARLPAYAVLVETNRFDLREVDRWFHRKGFVQDTTLASGFNGGGRPRTVYTDNLYVRRPGGPALVPDAPWPSWKCDGDSRAHRSPFFCLPWLQWQPPPKEGWGECPHLPHPPDR